jgi:hypothetical protein
MKVIVPAVSRFSFAESNAPIGKSSSRALIAFEHQSHTPRGKSDRGHVAADLEAEGCFTHIGKNVHRRAGRDLKCFRLVEALVDVADMAA